MKQTPFCLDRRSVLAILQGQKTQLRTVFLCRQSQISLCKKGSPAMLPYVRNLKGEVQTWMPYGDKGDILWVKERWVPVYLEEQANKAPFVWVCYECDRTIGGPFTCSQEQSLWFQNKVEHQRKEETFFSSKGMPFFVARLFLQITSIRLERLQDISDEDLIKEGFFHPSPEVRKNLFRKEWDGLRTYSNNWIENPYVWVIEFDTINLF